MPANGCSKKLSPVSTGKECRYTGFFLFSCFTCFAAKGKTSAIEAPHLWLKRPPVQKPLLGDFSEGVYHIKKEFDREGADENGVGGINAYYFGARMYDPETGIWFSVDPAGQDWNSYGYCGANPIIYVDPDGRFWIIIAAALVGAYLGGASQNEWNPAPWQWNYDSDTWKGIGIGALAGAALGTGAYFNLYSLNLGFSYSTYQGGSLGLSLTGIGSSLNFSAWGAYSLYGAGGAATIFAGYSLYNYGLGTSSQNPGGYEQDFTVGAYGTYGRGTGADMPVYGLNYNSPAGMNNYGNSVYAGQFITYNTATGGLTNQGMLGFRAGDVSFSYHNDHEGIAQLFGKGTDQGWTGGGGFTFRTQNGTVQLLNECFTGVAPRDKGNPANYVSDGSHTYWVQSPYMASLNRATTVTRYNGTVYPMSSSGWSQNVIHDNPLINTHRFFYP